jgi:hypothetical protein
MTPPERQNIINIVWLVIFAAAGVGCCVGIWKVAGVFARVILEIR